MRRPIQLPITHCIQCLQNFLSPTTHKNIHTGCAKFPEMFTTFKLRKIEYLKLINILSKTYSYRLYTLSIIYSLRNCLIPAMHTNIQTGYSKSPEKVTRKNKIHKSILLLYFLFLRSSIKLNKFKIGVFFCNNSTFENINLIK